MPRDIAIAGLLIRALANAHIAGRHAFGIRRAIIQMRGSNLDVPPNRIHHQRQHARVIDQVEKRLVLRQGIPHGKRIVGPQTLGRPNPLGHLVNRQREPIHLVPRQKILENDKSPFLKIPRLLLGHCKGHNFLLFENG